MSAQQELAVHVVDLLHSFGPCQAKRMFGGVGIFHQGLMIALIADGSLYLKVDSQTRGIFEQQGSHAFSYLKKDKECKLSYFLAPEDFFEDRDACLRWARLAYDAALRSARPGKSASK
jgi:DNA transformation protein